VLCSQSCLFWASQPVAFGFVAAGAAVHATQGGSYVVADATAIERVLHLQWKNKSLLKSNESVAIAVAPISVVSGWSSSLCR
jgi:hypothetical protein